MWGIGTTSTIRALYADAAVLAASGRADLLRSPLESSFAAAAAIALIATAGLPDHGLRSAAVLLLAALVIADFTNPPRGAESRHSDSPTAWRPVPLYALYTVEVVAGSVFATVWNSTVVDSTATSATALLLGPGAYITGQAASRHFGRHWPAHATIEVGGVVAAGASVVIAVSGSLPLTLLMLFTSGAALGNWVPAVIAGAARMQGGSTSHLPVVGAVAACGTHFGLAAAIGLGGDTVEFVLCLALLQVAAAVFSRKFRKELWK